MHGPVTLIGLWKDSITAAYLIDKQMSLRVASADERHRHGLGFALLTLAFEDRPAQDTESLSRFPECYGGEDDRSHMAILTPLTRGMFEETSCMVYAAACATFTVGITSGD